MVGDGPKSSDAWILHAEVKKSGKYPFAAGTEIVDSLKLRRVMVNLLSDIFVKDLGISKATVTIDEFGMKPGTIRMLFSELFRVSNRVDKLESGSISFFVFAPIHHLKASCVDSVTCSRRL